MAIDLTDVKWGSPDDDHAGGHRRRATEIISAQAKCSECAADWTAVPSLSNPPESGAFLDEDGVVQVTCPNGHADTRSHGPLLPEPR